MDEEEVTVLKHPEKLLAGILIFEKANPDKGRMLFSLRELPLKVEYFTESKASLQRTSDNEVLYQGKVKISCKAKETDVSKFVKTDTASTSLRDVGPSQAREAEKRQHAAAQAANSASLQEYPAQLPPGYEDTAETKQIIREAENTAKASKEAMQRVVRRAEETRQVAATTLETLETQGEQIKRVQEDVDGMHHKFDEADRELRSINSVFGQMRNAIKKDKKKVYDTNKKADKAEKGIRKEHAKEDKKEAKQKAKSDKKLEKDMKKRGLGGSNPDLPPELGVLSKEAQNDVIDTNNMLDSLGGTVADLKQMAKRMGNELEVQNERLDHLKASTDKTEVRLKATNVKVKKAG